MSKNILRLGIMVAGIALAIPSGGWSISAALGLSSLAVAGIEVGLAIVSSVLLGPSKPKNAIEAGSKNNLFATLDPTAPRKTVFGYTAMATDVRYAAYSGTNQDHYDQIIAVASHGVNSVDEIWLDNEMAWSAAGGVVGRFVNYLTVTVRTLGTSANGIALNSSWNANSTLTGCAYIRLNYKLTGTSSNEQGPFAGGITNRITIRGKGAALYDPRLDGTVPGGSGTQRANDQSTWTYGTTSARNPALQLLFYLLGSKINGKLAVGMGMPPARIDLPSFITAANICEEAVTLAAGGTEARYRSDGIISEGDDRQAVIENLCSTMNATLRDAGGKIALSVLTNDLATPVASFTEGDILGNEMWAQTPALTDSRNIMRGRYVDASNNALYQLVDFPAITLTSPDGIDRIETVDYPFVQSASQAQRLAKQRLQRNQFQGRYSASFGPRAWQVTIGNVIQLSHQGLGWSNKLFRVVAQTISPGGATKLDLLEENAAIYAWSACVAAPIVAAGPVVYDPLNSPLLRGIGAAGLTADVNGGIIDSSTGGSVVSRASLLDSSISLGSNGALAGAGGGQVTIGGLGYTGTLNATTNNITYSATAPASPTNGDIWVDTSVTPNLTKARVAGAWQIASNYVTNTNQVTDGANLGGTATWGGVTGAGKAADNATVGATWGTNLTGRPTELTDGRVAAGLNATGGIDFALAAHTNKSLATVDASANTKLGGIAAGATVGATWGTDLAGRPTELTDGRVAAGLNASGLIDFSRAHVSKSLANVDSAANTKLSGVETNADVTTVANGPVSATINYDNAGTTIQGTYDLYYYLTAGTSSAITSGVTATYTVTSGTVNGFNSTSGAKTLTVTSGQADLSITAMTTSTATITVNLTYNSKTRSIQLNLTRALAPPASGGGSSASQSSGFTTVVSPWTTYQAVSDVLVVAVPAGKTGTSVAINMSPGWGPKNISGTTPQPSDGPWHVVLKLQRSAHSANTWSDIGSVQGSSPDPYIDASGSPTISSPGSIVATITDTVTASTTYDYRLVAAITTGTTTGNSGGIIWTMGSGSSVSITVP